MDVYGQKIAIFASFSGVGGVEKMIVNLCTGLVTFGCQVELVLVKAESVYLNDLPKEVRVIRLNAKHSYSSFWELSKYFKKEKPVAVLAAKNRAGQTALIAKFLARTNCRVIIRIGTTVSAALKGRNFLVKLAWYLPMRFFYPFANRIVGISQGVVDDLEKITHMPPSKFCVIDNPVISEKIFRLSKDRVSHPWLRSKKYPVILGMGRLTRQKDFPTLIHAFQKLLKSIDVRLLILGEGGDRSKLQQLVDDLELSQYVSFPGFVENPYAYISKADLFVLSSVWEGFGNVLPEALALGLPVVSTDCPHGPREILQNGKYGELVKVGDIDGLAKAMLNTLKNPLDKRVLCQVGRHYTIENSSRRYLEVLLGQENGAR